KNSIQSGKIAHAYLFSGPRGCGKTSTARILAKALNCEKGPTATPCGQCSACKEITAGSSLDVIEIDGASNTSVNDVRQIKDEVLFPPNSCRYKIYIIDEVHMLSTSAFNALLKTIEEPPPYVIFVFATTELQKVPATIKSRCQQFNFRLVPIEKVKEQLALAANEIGIKADDEALYWIARESTGSMRDAYTLFDQVAAFSDSEITYDKIRDKLGLVGVDRLNELFGLCVQNNSSEALLRLDDYLQNGVSIEQLISNCTDYLRSLLLIKSGISKEALLGQSKDRYSNVVLEGWNCVQIERALDIFLSLYRDIRYSLSPRYEFELAVSRLCWLTQYVSSADVKKAIDAVKPMLYKAASAKEIEVSEVAAQKPAAQDSAAEESPSAGYPDKPPLQAPAQSSDQPPAKTPVSNGMPVFSALSESDEPYTPEDYNPGAPDDDAGVLDESSEGEAAQDPFQEGGIEPPSSSSVDASSIENVFKALVDELSVENAMLSGAVAKTAGWKLEEDRISATIGSQFELMQVRNGASLISEFLSKVYGRKIAFEVTLEEHKDVSENQPLPLEVQILRDTFKGSVINLK
ncbi:MAG: DNA polymerase III subunit gamma/tau, partial [Treponema sp.]|nr:DNA polymerase III subunit gamma/tau [Treponema sp.]